MNQIGVKKNRREPDRRKKLAKPIRRRVGVTRNGSNGTDDFARRKSTITRRTAREAYKQLQRVNRRATEILTRLGDQQADVLDETRRVLKETQNRYSDLYELAPIGFVTLDRLGRIEEVNKMAVTTLGRSRHTLLRSPFSLYVERNDLDSFFRHLLRCKQGQHHVERVETELRLKSSGREPIPVLLSTTPVSAAIKDGIVLFQTAIVDLTERKRAEEQIRESEEQLRAIIQQATAGIARADLQGRYVFVNLRFCQMLGYHQDELIGKTIREVTHPNDRKKSERAIEQLAGGTESLEFEKRFIRKDGSILWADVSESPMRDPTGKTQSVVAVAIDITERKEAEQSLAEAAEQEQALYQFVQRQHEAKSLRDIHASALDVILSTLQCDRAAILLSDQRGVMRFVDSRGLSAAYRKAVEGHSPWKPGVKDPQPIWVGDIDVASISKPLKLAIKAEGICATAFIPLVVEQKLIGELMTYYNAPHVFTDKEINLAVSIARQLALGVYRKRAEEALWKAKILLEERVRQRTSALHAANVELQEQIERRKGLEGEILEVSDREQQRLGQELHDGLCQHLTAVAFMIKSVALRLKNHRVIDVEDLEKISELISQAVMDARKMAHGLHKLEIDSANLLPALQDLVSREPWRTPCRLKIKTKVHLDNDAMASHLYRLLREAVINAQKHAQAKEIVVEIGRRNGQIVFSVIDDGIGIPAGPNAARGLGFHIMNYRARSIGARLEIASQKKSGTRVACYLPQPK